VGQWALDAIEYWNQGAYSVSQWALDAIEYWNQGTYTVGQWALGAIEYWNQGAYSVGQWALDAIEYWNQGAYSVHGPVGAGCNRVFGDVAPKHWNTCDITLLLIGILSDILIGILI